jgi:hypothetical protein
VTNDLVRRAAERNAAGHPEEARSILMFGRERSEEIFGVDHTSTVILENQLALLDRKTAAR